MVDTAAGEVITLSTGPGMVAAEPPTGARRAVAHRAGPVGAAAAAHRVDERGYEQHGSAASTYRLQFSAETTFADGIALLPYLDGLGAGALYASPLLAAGPGSNHGYDVVDPTRVSEPSGAASRPAGS